MLDGMLLLVWVLCGTKAFETSAIATTTIEEKMCVAFIAFIVTVIERLGLLY